LMAGVRGDRRGEKPGPGGGEKSTWAKNKGVGRKESHEVSFAKKGKKQTSGRVEEGQAKTRFRKKGGTRRPRSAGPPEKCFSQRPQKLLSPRITRGIQKHHKKGRGRGKKRDLGGSKKGRGGC